jgi:hypothetical protein
MGKAFGLLADRLGEIIYSEWACLRSGEPLAVIAMIVILRRTFLNTNDSCLQEPLDLYDSCLDVTEIWLFAETEPSARKCILSNRAARKRGASNKSHH